MPKAYVAVLPPLGIRSELRRTAKGLCLTAPNPFHITLMAPVEVSDKGLTRLAHDVSDVAERHWAFLVRLSGPIEAIRHSGSGETHFALRAEPTDELREISHQIHRDNGNKRLPDRTAAHLTLGRELDGDGGRTADLLDGTKLRYEFTLWELTVLSREDNRSHYRVMHRSPLRRK